MLASSSSMILTVCGDRSSRPNTNTPFLANSTTKWPFQSNKTRKQRQLTFYKISFINVHHLLLLIEKNKQNKKKNPSPSTISAAPLERILWLWAGRVDTLRSRFFTGGTSTHSDWFDSIWESTPPIPKEQESELESTPKLARSLTRLAISYVTQPT